MHQTVIILAAGRGEKMWPFTAVRNKALLPVGNRPLIEQTVSVCQQLGVPNILVVCDGYEDPLKHALRHAQGARVISIAKSEGSADSILKIKDHVKGSFAVLFADVWMNANDLAALLRQGEYAALVAPLSESSTNVIACALDQGLVQSFGGHHRGKLMTHHMVGFTADERLFAYLEVNPKHFTNLKVGVSSPQEKFVEVSLMDMMQDGQPMQALVAQHPLFDLDKPWHLMAANAAFACEAASRLKGNHVPPSSTIDSTALIEGFVQMGENSRIGRNVVVKGSLVVGDDTVIDQGVIVDGNAVIGDRCSVLNHVKIGANSVIGHDCRLDQGFELLGGVFFDHVYAVHYGEYFGIIGAHSDLGAGTTCGTLRFDDQETAHTVRGRKEIPPYYANACYLGDSTRTGVGALLMPGVKVGYGSVVGSGVILNEDVEDHTIIYVKQELVKKKWGPEKYGW
jgi:bifunctional UDP-N-acetylglucosamine pyrophosphorylase/glucosamine-1-phosphate N-acetyltransferase